MRDTVNGYPILRQAKVLKANMTRAGRVVLVHRPESVLHPYAIGIQYQDEQGYDSGWSQGHYKGTLQAAYEVFVSLKDENKAIEFSMN